MNKNDLIYKHDSIRTKNEKKKIRIQTYEYETDFDVALIRNEPYTQTRYVVFICILIKVRQMH